MALPVAANTTCDIYRSGNSPPAAPDVAGVPCVVKGDFARGIVTPHSVEGTWTHVLLVDRAVDVRDAYRGGQVFLEQDSVYVPDKDGTKFRVSFVERVGVGTAQEHKRVFLDRQLPTWPTNYV